MPEELLAVWQDTRERALRIGGDAHQRAAAAVAFLMVSSPDGAARRRQIWRSRLPEYLAERTLADYQVSSIQDLVHSWEPLIGQMRRQRTEQGADEPPPGHHHLVPLAAVADALGEGLRSSGRAARTGHNRPAAAKPRVRATIMNAVCGRRTRRAPRVFPAGSLDIREHPTGRPTYPGVFAVLDRGWSQEW